MEVLKKLVHSFAYSRNNFAVKIGSRWAYDSLATIRRVFSADNRVMYTFSIRGNLSTSELDGRTDTHFQVNLKQVLLLIIELKKILYPIELTEYADDFGGIAYMFQCANELRSVKLRHSGNARIRFEPERVFDDLYTLPRLERWMRIAEKTDAEGYLRSTPPNLPLINIDILLDTDRTFKNLMAHNLIGQVVLGQLFREKYLNNERCSVHDITTCFNAPGFLSVTERTEFYADDTDVTITGDLDLSTGEVVTNDDYFVLQTAGRLPLYGTEGFLNPDIIISPNMYEPFPLGTTIADLKRPLTNPPELRPIVPVEPPSPTVDADLEDLVRSKYALVSSGVIPPEYIREAVEELRRQQEAAGVPLIPLPRELGRIASSLGGSKRRRKSVGRKPSPRRYVRKSTRRSRSRSRSRARRALSRRRSVSRRRMSLRR